jgi:hypothetical protein
MSAAQGLRFPGFEISFSEFWYDFLNGGSVDREAKTQTQKKRANTFMGPVGFEPKAPFSERQTTEHTSDPAVIVMEEFGDYCLKIYHDHSLSQPFHVPIYPNHGKYPIQIIHRRHTKQDSTLSRDRPS